MSALAAGATPQEAVQATAAPADAVGDKTSTAAEGAPASPDALEASAMAHADTSSAAAGESKGHSTSNQNTGVRSVVARRVSTLPQSIFDVVEVSVVGNKLRQEVVSGFRRRSKKFTIYQILVRLADGTRWIVDRRYTQFYVLHRGLRKKFPDVKKLKFPKKKFFSSLARATVTDRQDLFNTYLQTLLTFKPRPFDLNTFLEIAEHAQGGETSGSGRMSMTGEPRYNVDDFELLRVLGKGSFGKVFLVRLLQTGDTYAMKVLKKSEVKRRKQIEHTKTERRIMGGMGMEHPFIVTLRFAFQTNDKLYMVTDYCKGGELFFHLKRFRIFSEDMVRFYSAEILAALEHLHTNGVVYRDLKPENVLLDHEGHVRITDFGLSRDGVTSDNGATTFCGTPEYLSPEMILHRKTRTGYGTSVDWWSLGTLMYEMFTGWPPFYDKNLKRMCEKILHQELQFPAKFQMSQDSKSVIAGMLDRNLETRLGSGEGGINGLKTHPFYSQIDWDLLMQRAVEPPFKPRVKSDTDIRNFDKTFTKLPAKLTPEEDDQHVKAALESDGAHFEDFTFAEASALARS